MKDLKKTIKHRKDSIQYLIVNLKKIFGGGVLLEGGIFSLALRQFVLLCCNFGFFVFVFFWLA